MENPTRNNECESSLNPEPTVEPEIMDVSPTETAKQLENPRLFELLTKRMEELEEIVKALQTKTNVEEEVSSKSEKFETNENKTAESHKSNQIPSHLQPVNPNHLIFLRGIRMKLEAVGNGMCLTNSASMHLELLQEQEGPKGVFQYPGGPSLGQHIQHQD